MKENADLGISSVSSVQHRANTAILYIWSEILLEGSRSINIINRVKTVEPFWVWDLMGVIHDPCNEGNCPNLIIYPACALLGLLVITNKR